MKKNTVILDLEIYNRLYDFEKNMKRKNTVAFYRKNYDRYEYLTTEQAVYNISIINDRLIEERDKLESQIKVLEAEKNKKEEPELIAINDIKNMSVREFKKWKKKIINDD